MRRDSPEGGLNLAERLTISKPALLLDILAETFPDSSRSTLRQMLRQGRVRVNGAVEVRGNRELAPGDDVAIGRRDRALTLPDTIEILHEDDDIIVIVKGTGLLTVSTEHEHERTAQAYLNQHLRAHHHRGRVWVVHRLDRESSGVLVFTKTMEAFESLKERLSEHDVDRVYIAVIEGAMPRPEGTIRSLLREDPKTFHVSSTNDPIKGRLAVTHYRTVASGDRYSTLEVTLETGRKNQIRVHLSEAGHPIVGDKRYGAKSDPMNRLGLHAMKLGFDHPVTGRRMVFEAPLPDEFRKLSL